MNKTELKAIRANKFKNTQLVKSVEATATVNKIYDGTTNTTDGQTLEATIINLRVGSGFMFWKVVKGTDKNASQLEVNDVIHFYAIENSRFFKAHGRVINQSTISKMIEWELVGSMDERDAKLVTEDDEVDLKDSILSEPKKSKPRKSVGLK